MYKYSRIAQDRFLKVPQFSFLFAYFAKSVKAREFALQKYKENKDKAFTPRMLLEMNCLLREAQTVLEKQKGSAIGRTMHEYLQTL